MLYVVLFYVILVSLFYVSRLCVSVMLYIVWCIMTTDFL